MWVAYHVFCKSLFREMLAHSSQTTDLRHLRTPTGRDLDFAATTEHVLQELHTKDVDDSFIRFGPARGELRAELRDCEFDAVQFAETNIAARLCNLLFLGCFFVFSS